VKPEAPRALSADALPGTCNYVKSLYHRLQKRDFDLLWRSIAGKALSRPLNIIEFPMETPSRRGNPSGNDKKCNLAGSSEMDARSQALFFATIEIQERTVFHRGDRSLKQQSG
jgi:hypothetical protein